MNAKEAKEMSTKSVKAYTDKQIVLLEGRIRTEAKQGNPSVTKCYPFRMPICRNQLANHFKKLGFKVNYTDNTHDFDITISW